MTLLILSLFAQAEDNKTEIDFEAAEINAQLKGPSFQRVNEVQRPTFEPLINLCIPKTFETVVYHDIK